MSQTCTQCSRANPKEAAYCYYDGRALDGHGGAAGPVNVGTQPFPSPFVFPSGQVCRNFDQLALACHDNWQALLEMLRQGYLEIFLSGLGRADLARAAREASHHPDPERGLDEFLTGLPTKVLQSPKLRVDPQEINLGLVQVGEDRRFEMVLENQGMRLLYGSITCVDCVWLALGDKPSVQQKLFQFRDELTLAVHVRGQYLRASQQPLEGRILIQSNSGKFVVRVRLEVPLRPFPEGCLAGALTPRQVAAKAKASPKEAAPLFEKGAVARWYESNGWKYPVQGPSASGLGAVQQFFEALGLVTAPQVDVSPLSISLGGRPRDELQFEVTVATRENRPVFAHGASDCDWLRVGKSRLKGRSGTIPVSIPSVPDEPGETLQAQVQVTANGNQRFVVAVRLAVDQGMPPIRRRDGGPARRGREAVDAPVVLPAALLEAVEPAGEPPAVLPVPSPLPAAILEDEPSEDEGPMDGGRGVPRLLHLLPVCILTLGLLVVILRDVFIKKEVPGGTTVVAEEQLLDPVPRIAVQFHDQPDDVTLGTGGVKPEGGKVEPRGIHAIWEPSMRFGLHMLREHDPLHPGQLKRLTFDDKGRTNNTCVRLDGHEWLFGERPFRTADGLVGNWPGRWQEREAGLGKTPGGRERKGKRSVWIYDQQQVTITQTVEIVPGEQTRVLDTCLVRYRIENQDRRPHRVGLRFLLDTFIGANDGVPFTIPGAKQLCDTMREFHRTEEIPDFIQALEKEDLRHPGTIAHVQLKLGGRIEPPDRVTLGAWPNPQLRSLDRRCSQEKTLWEVPVLSIQSLPPGDSAVTIYWNAKELQPGEARELGFAYGLGTVASADGQGQLALTVGGSFVPGGEFTVTAYVSNPVAGQTLTLTLPDGFTLTEEEAVQRVPPLPPGASSRNSPVTWRVKSPAREGQYSLQVQSSTGVSQTQPVTIRSSRLFD